ncbi:MAG: glycosyltransferase [Muribaculaceae bacterium]|nr:glycosyltransferase [Muribaculaceae bacterium]
MSEKTPLVSVLTLAYNQAPYIRECLDGVLMQKTNFAFELLIHDDASTDGTADIIREYEAKYPDIIKPIYQTENQYTRGGKIMNRFMYPRVKGKYIAMCEGDDYWTDPLKLQKQVDFMEANPDCSLCCHHMKVYSEFNKQYEPYGYPHIIREGDNGAFFENKDRIQGWFVVTLTTMFRNDKLKSIQKDLLRYARPIDLHLFYNLLKNSKGYYFKETMATYREHKGGVWSGLDFDKRLQNDLLWWGDLYKYDKDEYTISMYKTILDKYYYEIREKYGLLNALKFLYNNQFKCKEYPLRQIIKVLYTTTKIYIRKFI